MASLLSKFFGRTASEGAAFAFGLATGPVLSPAVEEARQAAWQIYPTRAVDPGTLAQGVAQGQVDHDWAVGEARRHGIDSDRFAKLVDIANVGPGMAAAFDLFRRNLLSESRFRAALQRGGIEQEWIDALVQTRDVLLAPAELANARQQGYIDQQRQHDEAALQGIDAERAEIQYEMVGLPPGVETALEMLRRGIIDDATFAQIVREGHTKTKYTDELLQLQDRVLSPSTYATLHLKGWIDQAAMHAGGALSGETAANMDLLYESMGRPAAPGQLWSAWARGVDGPAGRPMDKTQFDKAIAESDIRPEYADLLWGIRYLYPPLFQIGRLVQAGDIDAATATDWAQKNRYAPEVIAALQKAWTRGTGTTKKGLTKADLTAEYEGLFITRTEYVDGLKELGYSDTDARALARVSDARRRRTARNQLVNRAHTRYVSWRIDKPTAQRALATAQLDPTLADELVQLWDVEREINMAELTPAQLKRAYRKALLTRDEATIELEARGYAAGDVATLLDE